MRKAIKFCLALAMVGTLATQAYADVTVSGNAWFGLQQEANSDASADTSSTIMDMKGGTYAKIAASTKGDVWTPSSFMEIIFNEDDAALELDGWGFSIANETMTISLEDSDLGSVEQNHAYDGWIDDYNGAGDSLGTGDALLKVSTMGLTVMVGMNRMDDDADATGDTFSQTDMGLKYAGAAGEIAYAASYQSYSTAVNEDAGDVPDSKFDGAKGSEMAVGVGYTMGEMAFGFGYALMAETPGGSDAVETKDTVMSLNADFGLGDGAGVTVSYDTDAQTVDGEDSKVTTNTYISYLMPMLGAQLQVAYYSNSETPEGGDAVTKTQIGARLKYDF